MSGRRERVIKDKPGGLKTDTVVGLVRSILFVVPYPIEASLHVTTF